MASFEKINYNIRANKSIERKMISELIQRLSLYSELNEYRYIGLGSPYFTDFILFHKYLGLNNMISIEKEESKKARFEFNKPFSCIDMHYGNATTILPNLELDKNLNIIWMDYDGKIEDYVFSDIDSIVANSAAGSLFLVSINVEPSPGEKGNRMQELVDRVGKNRIPVEFEDLNLNRTVLPQVIYEMIDTQIKKSLLERTGGDKSILEYRQLFHYLYKDGAQMLTVGGILLDKKQNKAFKKLKTDNIKHLSSTAEPSKIKCPNLTYKEVHFLNNILPCELEFTNNGYIKNKEFKKLPLNHHDMKDFADIYRYYPNFSETNL